MIQKYMGYASLKSTEVIMLNRINNLLQQEEMIKRERATATQEILEAAKLLGINLETNNTIVKNEITINKGKIVELTKEIDNTDYATIEMLRETIRNNNAALNDANEQIEDLKDELEIKDALIANLKARLHNAEEELETMKAPKIYVEDEIFEEETKEEESEIVIGGDDVKSLLINVPDKYLAYPIVVETLNYWTNEIENANEKKLGGRVVLSKEKAKEMAIAKANEELVKHMSDIDKVLAYNVTHEETFNAKGAITSTFGTITLGGKEYAFKYGATFELPHVYGCMNMDHIHEAKAILDSIVVIDRDETQLGQKHIHQTIYDFDNNIVVWESDDGCFKGYTDKYAFVWDPSQAQPCGIVVKNALSNFRKYRKMNKSWGNGFVARAEFIMNYCRQMNNKTTNEEIETEETNEITVEFTNDNNAVETTNDNNAVETNEVVTEVDDLDI
jgi:hypothetical protein